MIHLIEGIENRKGILKNRLHILAEIPVLRTTELTDILAFIEHLARGWIQQAQHDRGQGRFPAATLSSHCDDPGRVSQQIKTDWIECVNFLLANPIELGDVLQLQCSLTHEAP